MRHRWATLITIASLCGLVFPFTLVWGADPPDFSNPQAVIQDIRNKIDICSEARIRNCMVSCGYAIKTIKNFIKSNPSGDPGILKQRWQPCFEAHRDADLPDAPKTATAPAPAKPVKKSAPATLDRSRFVISGLQLGGDMNSQKDRFFLLEAYGYHKKSKLEHNDVVFQNGGSKPGPDIIKNYSGTIKEAPVYIHFEATTEGNIYMIQFEQKEDMEVADVEAALKERFGKPTRHQGRYLIWGCNQGIDVGICVKANVSNRSLTIWASDGDMKKAAHKAYRGRVLKAKGVKKGAKF
jgi:hypothetical protein